MPVCTEAAEIEYPPQFHWAFVLILTWVTDGLFGGAWLIVQSVWVRRVKGSEVALHLAILHGTLTAIRVSAKLLVWRGAHVPVFFDWASDFQFVTWIAAVYTLRYELEREPIGLWLSYWLPILLGPVYFQYRLADYAPSIDGKRATGSLLGL